MVYLLLRLSDVGVTVVHMYLLMFMFTFDLFLILSLVGQLEESFCSGCVKKMAILSLCE